MAALNQVFFNIFENTQARKNSTIFQAKTQQTGSNSSHRNFKTHFVFNTFAVNKQKVLLFARSAPKNAIFGAFLPNFPPKTVIFSKK